MKKAGLPAASAIPGVVFGYALFVGILIKRITPAPIMAISGEREAAPPTRLTKREPAAVQALRLSQIAIPWVSGSGQPSEQNR